MRCILSLLLSAGLLFSSLLPGEIFTKQPAQESCSFETFLLSNAEVDTAQPPAEGVSVSAPSVVLMESSTGQVIYEKDPHTSLRPASITKIMTMILIFDALEEGKISLEDTVTVSEHAASMGGSQVFLEPGETQTVDTMLKCISVASANDACAAF
ncbi:MAG: D-alanyl-D-alanine carboxypeptidase [Lachnospiraceae bacterium]|nr:D-alanyl-D-alanine carboxypeptidase [Lachnospiraceae bacterium]